MNNILTGFFLLLATTIIIIFAYYITIIIGKKTKGLMSGRYTQVLERTMIGLNTNITIIKVNRKIYILALQGKTIKILDTIDELDWEPLTTENQNSFNLKHNINDIFKNRFSKK